MSQTIKIDNFLRVQGIDVQLIEAIFLLLQIPSNFLTFISFKLIKITHSKHDYCGYYF